MRGIRIIYFVLILVWLVAATIFFILNKNKTWLSNDDTNLILGIITVAVSILSLGLATMQKPAFKGKISIWHVGSNPIQVNNGTLSPIGFYNCITFKIDNRGEDPIESLVLTFRIPSKILYREIQTKYYEIYEFKETIYINYSVVKFLGNVRGDCDLIIEHHLNFEKWEKNRVIFMTVSGDNIRPTTYRIAHEEKENILNSNSKNSFSPIRA